MKYAGEHIANGTDDLSIAIIVCRLRVPATRGFGVVRHSETRLLCIPHSMRRTAEGYKRVCVLGLSDGRGYHWSGLRSSKSDAVT